MRYLRLVLAGKTEKQPIFEYVVVQITYSSVIPWLYLLLYEVDLRHFSLKR